MAKTAGGVRSTRTSRIRGSKVMFMAHKLHKLYGGKMSFTESMKMAWKSYGGRADNTDYKAAGNKAYLDRIRKLGGNAQQAKRSSYDDFNIPESAFYTNNKRGRFGSNFVGD
ncbi:hypothetical protein [uncultured Bacteroides sp.]|uniref:hypothetical protein n=1 Tax=uncultured Bacteroides sp. TaxID=162156 RepID=UPI0025EE24D7|nr:hypothetical protein [uncultured Bacteroides sp.]